MLIEFQLDEQRLLNGFRNRLRAIPICIPNEFPFNLANCSGPTLVDHMVIHNTTAFRRAPGPKTQVTINLPNGQMTNIDIERLQIVQPAIVHLVQRADLAASNTAATPACLKAQVTLVFDLSVQASGGAAELCVLLGEVEVAVSVPQELIADVQAHVVAQLPPTCTALDLGPLGQMMDGVPTVANAGISGDGNFDFVAIRLEVGTPAGNAGIMWNSFYAGKITSHLYGKHWSTFVDKGLILPTIGSSVSSAINKYNNSHWYDYNVFWGPTAKWSNPFDTARITVKFNGELEEACVCVIFPQDIEVEFHVITHLSVKQNDQLTSTINMDTISHDDFSIACCATTNMLAWALLGPHWLENKPAEEFWGIMLGGFAHLPLVFFGSLIMAGDVASMIPLTPPAGATCTKDAGAVVTTCTQDVDMGDNPLLGHRTLTGLRGLSDGPLLLGTLTAPPVVDQAGLSAGANGFDRDWAKACSWDAHIVSIASIGLGNTSSTPELAPLLLCEVTVLDDPPSGINLPSQYEPYMKLEDSSNVHHFIRFVIPESALMPEYLADPWPLRVLIKTSAGVREINIPGITVMTEEQKAKMETHLQIIKAVYCKNWIELKAKWWIDPEDPLAQVKKKHLWQVVASGMLSGESMGLRDPTGRGLGIAQANDGIAQISALVAPTPTGQDIAILANGEAALTEGAQVYGGPAPTPIQEESMRSPESGETSQSTDSRQTPARLRPNIGQRQLQIKQTPFVQHCVLRLPYRCLHLAAGQFDGLPALICATSTDLRVYDLTHPALPRLVFQRGMKGLLGAASWGNSLVVWGVHSLTLLSRAGASYHTPMGEPTLIREAEIGRGHLYTLSPDSVHVYDRALHKTGEIPVSDGSHLAVTGRTLLVANTRGVALFSLDDPTRPMAAGFREMNGVRGFVRPLLPNATNAVFVRRGERGGVVLHVGPGRQLKEVAHFDSDPWFMDVVHAGRVMAQLNPSRRYVTIYTAGPSMTSNDGSPPPGASRHTST